MVDVIQGELTFSVIVITAVIAGYCGYRYGKNSCYNEIFDDVYKNGYRTGYDSGYEDGRIYERIKHDK